MVPPCVELVNYCKDALDAIELLLSSGVHPYQLHPAGDVGWSAGGVDWPNLLLGALACSKCASAAAVVWSSPFIYVGYDVWCGANWFLIKPETSSRGQRTST